MRLLPLIQVPGTIEHVAFFEAETVAITHIQQNCVRQELQLWIASLPKVPTALRAETITIRSYFVTQHTQRVSFMQVYVAWFSPPYGGMLSFLYCFHNQPSLQDNSFELSLHLPSEPLHEIKLSASDYHKN